MHIECRVSAGPFEGSCGSCCALYRLTAIRNIDFHIATLTSVRRQQKVAFPSCKNESTHKHTDKQDSNAHTHTSKCADVMWKLCVVICAIRRKRKGGRRRTQTNSGGGWRWVVGMWQGQGVGEKKEKQTQKKHAGYSEEEADIGGQADTFTYA